MSPHHLHLIVNHLPVVGAIWLLIVLLIAVWRPSAPLIRLGLGLSVLLAITAGIAFWTGEPAEEAVEDLAGVSHSAIESHEEIARVALIAAVVTGLVGAAGLWVSRRRARRGAAVAALACVAVTVVLLGIAANRGGLIVRPDLRGEGTFPQEAGHEDGD
jgi:uncharacterized membrane protein